MCIYLRLIRIQLKLVLKRIYVLGYIITVLFVQAALLYVTLPLFLAIQIQTRCSTAAHVEGFTAGTSRMFSSQAMLQTGACLCLRQFPQSPLPLSDPGALYSTSSSCVKCVRSSSLSSSSRSMTWKVTQMLLLNLIPNASLMLHCFIPALVSSALSKFSVPDAVKMVRLKGSLSILELFHGKTLAFKDLAMTCTTRFLEYFLRKDNRRAIILVGKQEHTEIKKNK